MDIRTLPVTYIVIHHYGGWPPMDRETLLKESIADGFSDVPYTAYINPNGQLIPGRDEKYVGAANLGLNRQSLAICIGGNFDSASNASGKYGQPTKPSPAQLIAAADWIAAALHRHPGAKVIQHCDVSKLYPKASQNGVMVSTATACPGSTFRSLSYARLIWHMVCGAGFTEAYAKLRTELLGNSNKHEELVASLPPQEPEDEIPGEPNGCHIEPDNGQDTDDAIDGNADADVTVAEAPPVVKVKVDMPYTPQAPTFTAPLLGAPTEPPANEPPKEV